MADDQEVGIVSDPGKGYELSGKIMFSVIVILFAVVVFMVGVHLYARSYLVRLRRRQRAARQHRLMTLTQVVMYADRGLPISVVDHGLDLAVLNSQPVFLYSPKVEPPPPECSVCLSEFEEKEIVRLLPKCNHAFHIDCIDMWFRSHSTCPLCRSPVERVVGQFVPAVRPVEPVSEPGSSSGTELCAACQHEGGSGDDGTTSLEGRRKGVGIEVPPRRAESESELRQCSPAGRLLSLRRILSMGRRSPAGGGGGGGPTAHCGAGTSRGANELDLESGISELAQEPSRVETTT